MKTSTQRGKTRKVNIGFRRRIYNIYLRLVLLLKVFLVIFLLIFFFTNVFGNLKAQLLHKFFELSADYGFVLKRVMIEGQEYTPSADIMEALGADENKPLFAININDVKTRLEDNAWVKAVLVERRMPNTIYIAIVERRPIAIWQFQQQLYLIDEEGNRISKDNIEKFKQLPHVVGVDANIYAKSLIEDLSRFPDIANRVISAVRYGGRRWNLNLEQDITVKMPEIGFSQAYEYLNALNKKGKLFGQNYKIIDLRDLQKFYIEEYSK